MNEQLEILIKKAIEAAEKTGEFVIDQAPDVLQEFYRWHLISNAFTAVILILATIAIWKMFKAIGRKSEDDFCSYTDTVFLFGKHYETLTGIMLLVMGVIFGGGLTLGFAIQSIYNVVFIYVAPKLYLIEYFIK